MAMMKSSETERMEDVCSHYGSAICSLCVLEAPYRSTLQASLRFFGHRLADLNEHQQAPMSSAFQIDLGRRKPKQKIRRRDLKGIREVSFPSYHLPQHCLYTPFYEKSQDLSMQISLKDSLLVDYHQLLPCLPLWTWGWYQLLFCQHQITALTL